MTAIPITDALAFAGTGLMLGTAVMALMQLVLGTRTPISNSWLVAIAGAVVAMGLGDISAQLGALDLYRFVQPLADAALLVIGPALWLYVRQWSAPSTTRGSLTTGLLHLAPAGILCLLLAVMAMLYAPEPRESHRTAGEILVLLPIAAQLVAYAIALALRVAVIRRRTLSYYSDLEGRDLKWILVMTLLYIAGVVAWILTWRWTVAASNALTSVLVAAATAWLGIRGSRQRLAVEAEPQPAQVSEPEPYSKARLPDARAEEIRSRLAVAMAQDKAWLEADLTLAELASRVGATTHQLSQYLSMHEQQSFYDYVNRWRVDAVKATLLRAGSARRPLLEVALECGFGSKSAFNTVFKRFTGQSPSAFRDALPGSAAQPLRDKSMS